jgi:hypothetical protein
MSPDRQYLFAVNTPNNRRDFGRTSCDSDKSDKQPAFTLTPEGISHTLTPEGISPRFHTNPGRDLPHMFDFTARGAGKLFLDRETGTAVDHAGRDG